jgi:hypothetical protein
MLVAWQPQALDVGVPLRPPEGAIPSNRGLSTSAWTLQEISASTPLLCTNTSASDTQAPVEYTDLLI